MKIQDATESDLTALAEMNRQLIIDEGHSNPMNISQLRARMQGWLATEYRAVIISSGDIDVGYALWREEPEFIHVRQFFIGRQYRRKGLGRRAISELIKTRWLGRNIRLEVLTGNSVGQAFWHAAGFKDYCITLEYRDA